MRTTREAREEILRELGTAVELLELSTTRLGDAFELMSEASGERLEDTLYRPVQRALGRAKRTHSSFAQRVALPGRKFETPGPSATSQGAKALMEVAMEAAQNADRTIVALQDSMLPVEAGDPELRAGLGEVRESLAPVSNAARELFRTLGR